MNLRTWHQSERRAHLQTASTALEPQHPSHVRSTSPMLRRYHLTISPKHLWRTSTVSSSSAFQQCKTRRRWGSRPQKPAGFAHLEESVQRAPTLRPPSRRNCRRLPRWCRTFAQLAGRHLQSHRSPSLSAVRPRPETTSSNADPIDSKGVERTPRPPRTPPPSPTNSRRPPAVRRRSRGRFRLGLPPAHVRTLPAGTTPTLVFLL